MKVKYSSEVDILYIKLTDSAIEESDEDKPGVVIDYAIDGSVVGTEIMNASKRCLNLQLWNWKWLDSLVLPIKCSADNLVGGTFYFSPAGRLAGQ